MIVLLAIQAMVLLEAVTIVTLGTHLVPEFYRRGFGKALLEKAFECINQTEFSEILVWVQRENQRARCFYEAMEFSEIGESRTNIHFDVVTLTVVQYKLQIPSYI